MEEVKAQWGQYRLHTRRVGLGERVIFSHADFVDSRMWDGVMNFVSSKYEAFCWDKTGFGASDIAREALCRRRELERVVEFAGGEAVHLVGCSNGGQQALDFALEHPELVLSLTLINSSPSGFVPEGPIPAELSEMIQAMQEGRLEDANELQTRIWFDGPSRKAKQINANRGRGPVKEMNMIFIRNNTFFTADLVPLDPLDPPAITRLDEIRVPVLVIDGELDYSENRRANRLLYNKIPGSQLVTMPGCAHVPPVEEPEQFSRIWFDFQKERIGKKAESRKA